MMVRLDYEQRKNGLIARVTLDNPRKLNIFNRETMSALVQRMREAVLKDGLRAVVLTGAGDKAFVGGADLDALRSLDPASARAFITQVHEACASMRECPVPVVTRVNGYCIGAGLELAAACDIRIAVDTAVFSMPEVRLGIPSVVQAALLPRLVGAGRARWLVMTGEAIHAPEALAWGLVEKVVSADQLDTTVNAVVDAILAGSDDSIRAQKRLCKMWEEAPLDTSIRASVDEFARAYESREPGKRIAAFRQAHKPKG